MNHTRLTTAIVAFATLTLPLSAVDHHVTTAQEFQNALTTAAVNAADDTIYLAAGFYQGNFSFTSAETNSLIVEAEPGLTRGEVTLDGSGVGGALSLSSSVVSNFVVRRITISRNCGDPDRDALRLATLGTVTITDLASLSASKAGRGIHVAAAASLVIEDCDISATGTANTGQGLLIEGVGGTIAMTRNVVKGNRYVVLANNANVYGGGIRIVGTAANNVVNLTGNTIQSNLSQNTGYQSADTGAYGAGIHFDGGVGTDSISLTTNTITANNSSVTINGYPYGGGIYATAETLTLSGNQFTSNTSFDGGGCYFSGSSATISDNSFVSNATSPRGGALYLACTSSTVINNVFRSNTANSSGGAVYWRSSNTSSACTITNNQFYDNRTTANLGEDSGGGAVWCSGYNITLTGNRFERNASGVRFGAAVFADLYDTSATAARKVTFINNTVLASQCTSEAVTIWGDGNNPGRCTLDFRRNRITGSVGCRGVYAGDFATMLVADNLLAENTITTGTGAGANLLLRGQSGVAAGLLDIVNNTITGNSGSSGGGLYLSIAGTTEVVHCYNNISWGNSATGAGDDVLIGGFGSRTEFFHNIVHDMSGVWSITGDNLDLAPIFFDPTNGDYHLRYNSPGLNIGDNAAPGIQTIDLDGVARVQDGTVELGCFEFSNTDFHPADANADWAIDTAEFNAYAAAWKNDQAWSAGPSPVPADYLTRAGYLKENGGTYHNDGGAKPVCWKPGAGN